MPGGVNHPKYGFGLNRQYLNITIGGLSILSAHILLVLRFWPILTTCRVIGLLN